MLTVSGGRSRNRSKSPGGRERSTSRVRDGSHERRREPAKAPSPPKGRPSRTKKYYESDSEELSETESEDDRRYSKRYADPKLVRSHRADDDFPSSGEDDERKRRGSSRKYSTGSKERQYEVSGGDHRSGRHPSYADPIKYEYAKPSDLTRHMSYSRPEEKRHGDYDIPGSFDAYEDKRPVDHTRHMSIKEDVRKDPHLYQEHSSGGKKTIYQVPGKFEYAQPSHNIKYLNKADAKAAGYVASAHQQVEIEPRRLSKYEDKRDDRRKPRREESDSEEERYRRAKKEKERRKSKYEEDSESEEDQRRRPRRSRYSDSESEEERAYRKSKYREVDDDRHQKKPSKYRDDPDDKKKSRHHEEPADKKKVHHRGSDEDKKKPKHRESDASEHKHGAKYVEIEPRGLGSRSNRLSVSGAEAGALMLAAPGAYARDPHAGGLPPGSPLLEAYRGTYQSISPMPSPIALPRHMDDGLDDLEPLDMASDSDDPHSRGLHGGLKRVKIFDPEQDAKAIGADLKLKAPTGEILVKILPPLTHDSMMALREEYKKHFKVSGKGINVAKHIKTKIKGKLGTIAYWTALGKWEMEAWCANVWYNSNSTRRELLIESLIGRTNHEVKKIKEAFSDKRYNNDLVKCMQAELKKDKFRVAVLQVLEENRQEETDPIDGRLVAKDVVALYNSLTAKEGGETDMIKLVLQRSDKHLRLVLQEFEKRFNKKFQREIIKKSQNLVGEVLAHILNGVINRPLRDALLIHQALEETTKDRAELLISRLVRLHWDVKHLHYVKEEYMERYNSTLVKDLEAKVKGEFGAFCVELCKGARK